MSDVEHVLVTENRALRADIDRVCRVARRAITAMILAQDGADGTHEAWLDEALASVTDVEGAELSALDSKASPRG
jgi:hypothetical protein